MSLGSTLQSLFPERRGSSRERHTVHLVVVSTWHTQWTACCTTLLSVSVSQIKARSKEVKEAEQGPARSGEDCIGPPTLDSQVNFLPVIQSFGVLRSI